MPVSFSESFNTYIECLLCARHCSVCLGFIKKEETKELSQSLHSGSQTVNKDIIYSHARIDVSCRKEISAGQGGAGSTF